MTVGQLTPLAHIAVTQQSVLKQPSATSPEVHLLFGDAVVVVVVVVVVVAVH